MVTRTERGVIQSPWTRTIEIIQESRVDDLLDGDTTNILRGQEGKDMLCTVDGIEWEIFIGPVFSTWAKFAYTMFRGVAA